MDDFTLTSISILTLTIATFDIIYHTLRRRSPPPSHPPTTTTPPILSPPKFPIIGHLHLLTSMPHHSFAKLSRQLGPIIHLQLGRVPTIVISSPQLAQLVLKTHDHVFSNRPHLISAQYLSFNCSDVTFSRYGPYWRQARKICVTELLSPKRVNSFLLVRVEEVTRVVQSLSTRTGMEVKPT